VERLEAAEAASSLSTEAAPSPEPPSASKVAPDV